VLTAIGLPGAALISMPISESLPSGGCFAVVLVCIASMAIWGATAYSSLFLVSRLLARRQSSAEKMVAPEQAEAPPISAAFATVGVIGCAVLIYASAMYFERLGRDLLTSYERSREFESFQIGPSDAGTLWQIEAWPARSVGHLRYGEVPDGFRQVVPVAQGPRPLRRGERLRSLLLAPGEVVELYGRALDESRVLRVITAAGPRRFPRGLSRNQMQEAIDRRCPSRTDVRSCRESMVNEAFTCRDIRDRLRDSQRSADFVLCRRTEATGRSSVRTWEVALVARDGKISECVVSDQPDSRRAR
jgi:hypothetical protein